MKLLVVKRMGLFVTSKSRSQQNLIYVPTVPHKMTLYVNEPELGVRVPGCQKLQMTA